MGFFLAQGPKGILSPASPSQPQPVLHPGPSDPNSRASPSVPPSESELRQEAQKAITLCFWVFKVSPVPESCCLISWVLFGWGTQKEALQPQPPQVEASPSFRTPSPCWGISQPAGWWLPCSAPSPCWWGCRSPTGSGRTSLSSCILSRSPSSALLPFFGGGFPYYNRLQKN